MSIKDPTSQEDQDNSEDTGWKPEDIGMTSKEDKPISPNSHSVGKKKEWTRNTMSRSAKVKKEDGIMLHIKRGVVKGLQQRTESSKGDGLTQPKQTLVWNFRIERYFDGKRLLPIAVEMRGRGFNGSINEGDEVEIYEKWREGKLVRTNRIKNWTNGIDITSKNDISVGQILLHIIFWGALIAAAIAIIFLK